MKFRFPDENDIRDEVAFMIDRGVVTINRICKELGYPKTTVYRWYNGERSAPYEMIKDICDYIEQEEITKRREAHDKRLG